MCSRRRRPSLQQIFHAGERDVQMACRERHLRTWLGFWLPDGLVQQPTAWRASARCTLLLCSRHSLSTILTAMLSRYLERTLEAKPHRPRNDEHPRERGDGAMKGPLHDSHIAPARPILDIVLPPTQRKAAPPKVMCCHAPQ
jgi:hypothetical protein